MKGVENIVGRVAADAQAAAKDIAAAASAQAEKIIADNKVAAGKAVDDIIKKAEAGSADIARRADSMMKLEGRKTLLAERQNLIEEAFVAAAAKLAAITKDPAEYVKVLTTLAGGALPNSTLLVAKTEFDAVAKDLGQATGLSVEAADLPGGGLVVKLGEVEVNLTFTALLRQYREELEQSVAAALFS